MSHPTVISSLESIPLPPAASQIRRPVRDSVAAKAPQALDSNASENQASMRGSTMAEKYVAAAGSVEREVEPITRAVLSNSTLLRLHFIAMPELDALEALTNEGRRRIKERLLPIWDEMAIRFERGEAIDGISGTGGKGMGKYLRKIGIKPSKRRLWKFEIRREDTLRLTQKNLRISPPKRGGIRSETRPNTESEANALVQACINLARLVEGDSVAAPRERSQKTHAMAKEILEAVKGGNYDRIAAPSFVEHAEAAKTNDAAIGYTGRKRNASVSASDEGPRARVEFAEDNNPDYLDKSASRRGAIECIFVLTKVAAGAFMSAVKKLGPARATEVMFRAVVDAAAAMNVGGQHGAA